MYDCEYYLMFIFHSCDQCSYLTLFLCHFKWKCYNNIWNHRCETFKFNPLIGARTLLIGFIFNSVFLCTSSNSNLNFCSSKMMAIFDCNLPKRIPKKSDRIVRIFPQKDKDKCFLDAIAAYLGNCVAHLQTPNSVFRHCFYQLFGNHCVFQVWICLVHRNIWDQIVIQILRTKYWYLLQ